MKHFRWVALCLVSFGLVLWLNSCSAPPFQVVSLNFGAAGMVRGALEEMDAIYQQEHPNVLINFTFIGSQPLQAALEQGELFDGILLADIPPLDELQAKGFILPASRREMMTTDVVAIARIDSPIQLSDFRELTDDRIKTVAIGGKSLASGRYTHNILTSLGIAQAVESKAVMARVDVREVLRAVELGDVEVGITFLSEAKTSDEVKVLATVPREIYQPVRSGAAVVKASAHPEAVQQYLDFLSSDRARVVFEKFGLRPLVSQ